VVFVSPFKVGGSDTLAGAVARSLSDAIVDTLAAIGGLRAVAVGDDSAQAADSLLRGAEIGLIVGGSVERRGNDIKATGRVSDGITRVQLFSQGQPSVHCPRWKPTWSSALRASCVAASAPR
jgi:hypothetical protein